MYIDSAKCKDGVFGDKAKGMIYKWLKDQVEECTEVVAEFPVPGVKGRKRIDLYCKIGEYKIGIEIKSSPTDLHSGFGLHQESEYFDFGYVVLFPRYNDLNLIERTIGWLSLQGMENTGILLLKANEDNPARYHFEVVRDAASRNPFFKEDWTPFLNVIDDNAAWKFYSCIKEEEDAKE